MNRFANTHDFLLLGWRFYDRATKQWWMLNPDRIDNPHAQPRFVLSPAKGK